MTFDQSVRRWKVSAWLYGAFALAVLLYVATATAGAPVKPAGAWGQADFIRDELKHMGWACGPRIVANWECVSPDEKVHIYFVDFNRTERPPGK